MTRRILASSVVALAAFGVTVAGVATAEPAAPQVQDAAFGAPLPLEPAPAPAPPAPAQPGAPLPTTDEVSGMLTKLSDAGISYKEKGNLVENGITPEEGRQLDHELRKAHRDGQLPYTFDVLNVVPTDPNQALANVTVSGPKIPAPVPVPVQLVDQGSWVLSRDAATQLLQVLAAH